MRKAKLYRIPVTHPGYWSVAAFFNLFDGGCMSEKLKIIYRPLKDLTPYVQNARTHDETQVAQLVASIEEFGWTNPVLIDEMGEIIAGHGRVRAAEAASITSVPTITLSGLTDAQKRAYRLADNRLPLNAGWNDELLALEFTDLLDDGFDLALTGFIQAEIDEMILDVDLPGEGITEDPYSAKIESPVYQPSGEVPEISELYDEEKANQLSKNIRAAKLPQDIENFLLAAAERHTVFNFGKIADYYSEAPANIQRLFEESALVIIDYRQAIDNGFVSITKKMADIIYAKGEEDA